MSDDLISRQAAIDAVWKALYEYEDKTEQQFQESDELDVGDWIIHRIFVQNMSDIDRRTILDLPSVQPTIDAVPVVHGRWVGISDGYADGFPVYDEWECSQCGVVFEDEKPIYKYCPNCGARMDGES